MLPAPSNWTCPVQPGSFYWTYGTSTKETWGHMHSETRFLRTIAIIEVAKLMLKPRLQASKALRNVGRYECAVPIHGVAANRFIQRRLNGDMFKIICAIDSTRSSVS